MNLDPINISSILVAVIAALGAWAAQRSAAKANRLNSQVSVRLQSEQEAYERARAFDIQTIDRQTDQIRLLQQANDILTNELNNVKRRLNTLENLIPNWEDLLEASLNEPDD